MRSVSFNSLSGGLNTLSGTKYFARLVLSQRRREGEAARGYHFDAVSQLPRKHLAIADDIVHIIVLNQSIGPKQSGSLNFPAAIHLQKLE